MKTILRIILFLNLFVVALIPAVAQVGKGKALKDSVIAVWEQRYKQKMFLKKQQHGTVKRTTPATGTAKGQKTLPACFIPVDGSFTALERSDDDGVNVALPFTFNLYGTMYDEVFINTNGTLTFEAANDYFYSYPFPIEEPVIAPFWGDVDTRSPQSGQIFYKVTPTALIVTWNGVGYHSEQADLVNTFQVIMGVAGDPLLGPGIAVKMNYGDMQWASADGFGGAPSMVGINGVDDQHFQQLGRFNASGAAYDGPGGNHDGIEYLDNKCFSFNTAALDNIPPRLNSAEPFQIIHLKVGETVEKEFEFLAPEAGQTVTTIFETEEDMPCNVQFTTTGGAVSRSKLKITGSACNEGVHMGYLVAMDNGSPQQSRAVTVLIFVEDSGELPVVTFPQPVDEDGDGRYPLLATSSDGRTVAYFVQTGNAYIEDDNILVADGVGEVIVRAYVTGTGGTAIAWKDATVCLPSKHPGAIFGDAIGCVGTSSQYFVPVQSGALYNWSVTGGTVVANGIIGTVTWTTAGPQTISVSMFSACGTAGPVSTYTVQVGTNQLSGTITRMLPSNGNNQVSFPINFSWFPVENALSYDIYVWPEGQERPASPLIHNIKAINYRLSSHPSLEYGKQYQWQVVARAGCSALNSPVQSFGLRLLPDLQVVAIDAPPGGFSGEPMTVSWEVRNNGPGSTLDGKWLDRVILSLDQVLDEQDLVMATTGQVSALGNGASYTGSASFTLPNGINNKYYVFVTTDVATQLVEHNNDNNTRISAATTHIQLTPAPDLRVSSVVPPNNTFSGQRIGLQYTLDNAGEGRLSGKVWHDIVYLSKDPVLNILEAINLGTFSNSKELNAGENLKSTVTLTLPVNVSGSYYIHLVTDHLDRVYEHAGESNNQGRSEVINIILAPPVDLVVPKVTHAASSVAGEKLAVNWRVENAGASSTDLRYWLDEVYLSPTPELQDVTAIKMGTFYRTMHLGPDEGYYTTGNITLPKNISGDYYVIVKADGRNDIFEADLEGNNTGKMAVPLHIGRPDLIVPSVTVPATAVSGQTIEVIWKVKNNGTAPCPDVQLTDHFLLSQSADWDVNKSQLLKVVNWNTPSMAAGKDSVLRTNLTLPNGINGQYYLFVMTDRRDTVNESNNNNNIGRSVALPVSLAPWADLQVTKVQAPDRAAAGSTTTISYSVVNKGNTAVRDSLWQDSIYVSRSPVWDAGAAVFVKSIPQQRNMEKEGVYEVQETVKVPGQAGGDGYYWYIVANANKVVYEHGDTVNNRGRSGQVNIEPYPPVDLAVTAVTAATAGSTGKPVVVKWTVQNKGAAITLEQQWKDGIYLSTDTKFDAGDKIIKYFTHKGALDVNAAYTQEQTVVLPNDAVGQYYLLVYTDVEDKNRDAEKNNNTGTMRQAGSNDPLPMGIELTPPADLVVGNFKIPDEGYAGQPVKVQFTVKNAGTGVTPTGTWVDKIFLSTDLKWDTDDRPLASRMRMEPLAPGASYEGSLDVFLPMDVLGHFALIYVADANGQVYEHQAEKNEAAALITIVKDELSDLAVSEIRLPAEAVAGAPVTIEWMLTNRGVNPARGYFQEGVYLSTDKVKDKQDVLMGVLPTQVNLAPGMSMMRSLRVDLKGVSLQDYHALIHTDQLNNIAEVNDDNNLTASEGVMRVTVDELPIRQLRTYQYGNATDAYYRIEVPDSLAGETMLLTLRGDELRGDNEAYLRLGGVPTRAVHDYAYGEPNKANQDIVVPSLQAGTYYLLVHARTSSPDVQPVKLLADILHFEIRSVEAAEGGNTGMVTVQIKGAKLGDVSKVRLRNASGIMAAAQVEVTDPSGLFARFNLEGAATGVYTVVAENSVGDTAVLNNGFSIKAGVGGSLAAHITSPPNARLQNVVSFQVEFANTGNTDIINPKLKLTSLGGAPIALQLADLEHAGQDIILSLQEIGGPAGRLRPGAKGTILVYAKATTVLGFMLMENNPE